MTDNKSPEHIEDTILSNTEVDQLVSKYNQPEYSSTNKKKVTPNNKEDNQTLTTDVNDIQQQSAVKGQKGFTKGISGNKKGRPPKSKALTDIIKRLGSQRIDKQERNTLLAQKIWDLALEGDKQCIEMIWNRTDGKVTEHKEITLGKISDKLPDQTERENITDQFTNLKH